MTTLAALWMQEMDADLARAAAERTGDMRPGWENFVRGVLADSIHDPQRAKELYNELRGRKGCAVARGQYMTYASERVVRDLLLAELVELIET